MPPLKPFSKPAEVLGYEILQEQASALGRLGRALESALARLQAFDEEHPRQNAAPAGPGAAAEDQQARRALVSAAGDSRTVMRDYRVPAEVQERMGIFPARKGGSL
jgi:hypothetical protein